jgi:hypothetical protein
MTPELWFIAAAGAMLFGFFIVIMTKEFKKLYKEEQELNRKNKQP